MGLKYIVIEGLPLLDVTKVPIIFPDVLNHSDVWGALKSHLMGLKLVSAGMLSIDDKGECHCFGHSDSTGKKSRPEDAGIVQKEFNNGWK